MNVSVQQHIASRFGSLFMPAAPLDKAGVALQTLALRPLNAFRHQPVHGTSGWYIWGGEVFSDDPSFFAPVHHQHLAQHCPSLEPYLGLGPGWRVLLAPNQEEVWFDSKLLAV
jgi:hypothetical protein